MTGDTILKRLAKVGRLVMSEPAEDRWASWSARRRHGGDPDLLRRTLEYLAPIRDRIIADARLQGATARSTTMEAEHRDQPTPLERGTAITMTTSAGP